MKINISSLHLDLLDDKRLEVFHQLVPLTANYVLGGGTVLALQINHRLSYDFDFFSAHEIPENLAQKMTAKIKVGLVSIDTSDELTFYTKDNIKVTILYYPFPMLFEPLITEENLRIYQVKEIAVHKAYTIGRRPQYRDYFDLYTVLTQGYITLEEVITGAESMYKENFNKKAFLQQLTYSDDLRDFEIMQIQKPEIMPSEVFGYFDKVVGDVMR